jgi:transposase-like protein
MSDHGKKPPPSFVYPDFKAKIVESCQHGDMPIGRVARDFDLTETAVRECVMQATGPRRPPRRRLDWRGVAGTGRTAPESA